MIMLFVMLAALAFSSISALLGRSKPMLYTSVMLLVLNDFILVPVRGTIPSALLLAFSSWPDLFVLVGFIAYAIWFGHSPRIPEMPTWFWRLVAIMVFITLQGIVFGLMRGSLFGVIANARTYVLPLFLPLALYANGAFQGREPIRMLMVIFTLAIAMAAYSAYLSITFNGDPASIWYFDFIFNTKVSGGLADRFVTYQVVRGGHLRAAGFLISAVDYSIFCGLILVPALCGALFFRSLKYRIYSFVAVIACVVGTELSRTRVAYSIFAVSMGMLCLYRLLGIRKAAQQVLISITLVVMFLGLVAVAPSLFDASVNGRIGQFLETLVTFRPQGWGFGATTNLATNFKDSMYLSSIGALGASALLFWYVLFTVHRKAAQSLMASRPRTDDYALRMGAVMAMASAWFAFGVHYFIGGSGCAMLFLLLFAAIRDPERRPARTTKIGRSLPDTVKSANSEPLRAAS
ncbi:hypothetical protein [Novosphingobium album (ex Liu et al. 2023)]|uniref:O-antigen ligase domain-containing protein n=1 Tax=Novosphingobium album (ex Liu et al. 2023) TaxID=3031130 RepID=A0ABT5WQI6_9SPHN|nr:hypothetical protein [Novosphingobium album (ex Liu et al. 2023)]MDE8652278.1 hypothetical protein [Novosphingobium album (ex Liu et al. 2023)]